MFTFTVDPRLSNPCLDYPELKMTVLLDYFKYKCAFLLEYFDGTLYKCMSFNYPNYYLSEHFYDFLRTRGFG